MLPTDRRIEDVLRSLSPLMISREVKKRLPLHTGAFFMFLYALSIFLTSTAFADTKANIYFFKMSHDTRLNIFTPRAQYGIFISICILGTRGKAFRSNRQYS